MSIGFADRIKNLTPSGIRRINEKALALERKGVKVCHFELGRPDFDTPEYIKKTAVESLGNKDVFYTSNFGKPPLREEVACYLSEKKKINVTAENILITVGLAEAIFDIFAALLNPGDEVLVPDPVWMNYINVPKLFGAVPVTYSLFESRGYQPDIRQIESVITDRTKAIVLVSPHNPTGSMPDKKVVEDIAAVAKKHDLIVISDEIYERLTYGDKEHVSIASFPDMENRTFTLNGFSKAYSMTGWRIGYVAAPPEWIRTLNLIHQVNTTSAASFVQTAAISALRDEGDEVEKMRGEYLKRRDFAVSRINGIKGLSCRTPEGAFYIFVNISGLGIDCVEFADRLLEEFGVATVPGTVFGNNGNGYIRLSFASSMEELQRGLDILEKAAYQLH